MSDTENTTEEVTKEEVIKEEVTKEKKKKWLVPVIIIAAVVLIAVVILVVLATSGKLGIGKNKKDFDDKFLEEPSYDTTTLAYSELLEIAAKALEDGDYAAAIENYEKVLEMDDTVVDAYLGIIEAYIRSGDFDKALETAKKGYEKTGDQRLKDKIDMLEAGNIVDARGLTYKETTYDANHVLQYWVEHTYDSKGNRTSVTSYDAGGNMTGHVDCVSNDPNMDILYGYEGGTVIKVTHEYDSQRRVIKETVYSKAGEVALYILNEYEGDKMLSTQYGADDSVVARTVEYHEGNKRIWEYYTYSPNFDTYTLSYKSVSEGNRVDYYDEEGKLDYYIIYGENGNTEYNADGSIREYSVKE